jgi:hypothetical protein
MGWLSLIGSGLTAYGPALVVFFLLIASNVQMVILMISRCDCVIDLCLHLHFCMGESNAWVAVTFMWLFLIVVPSSG